jgi:predicted nicotinamide N-methyase
MVTVAGQTFDIACLDDAADLLDEPDYAKRFLEEDRAPYGLELWPAAIMLAEYILQHESNDGGRAIEIGCGLALVSMAAARAGWIVTATDNEPTSLRFARYNAGLNGAPIEAFEPLDWRHPPAGRRFDRVYAADVLYQLVDHEPVLHCLRALLAPDGLALVADPNRSVADRFAAMAEPHGFTVEVIPTAAPGSAGKRVEGRIFRMRFAES